MPAQEPVHSIRCHQTKESREKAAAQQSKQSEEAALSDNAVHSEREEGAIDTSEKDTGREFEAESASPSSQEAAEQGLAVQLETLSDEAMDELVSSIIRQATQEDPDVDFLGLTDEDEIHSSAEDYSTGRESSERPGYGHEDVQRRSDDEELQEQAGHHAEEL